MMVARDPRGRRPNPHDAVEVILWIAIIIITIPILTRH